MITSEEVNYLVWRYLQESGFIHTSFTFGNEARIISIPPSTGTTLKTSAKEPSTNLAPGALITYLQKGLLYLEAETHLNENGEEKICNKPFSLLTQHECPPRAKRKKTIKIPSLQNLQELVDKSNITTHINGTSQNEATSTVQTLASPIVPASSVIPQPEPINSPSQQTNLKSNNATNIIPPSPANSNSRLVSPQMEPRQPIPSSATKRPRPDELQPDVISHGTESKRATMDVDMEPHNPIRISDDRVMTLLSHSAEVLQTAWNPYGPQISSASSDGTARIWQIPAELTGAPRSISEGIVLRHFRNNQTMQVTTIEWSPKGSQLATGCYDGFARIWSPVGELLHNLEHGAEPLFAIRYSPSGKRLLSSGVDGICKSWDTSTGNLVNQYKHTSPAMDLDWLNDSVFATCGNNGEVYVCGGVEERIWSGHEADINTVRWNSLGYLASAGDDGIVAIWDPAKAEAIDKIKEHTAEVYMIRWSPLEPHIIATASVDTTIKLYDTQNRECLHTLSRHRQTVYSIAFSPNGLYLASGSTDKMVFIWRVKDGECLSTYEADGGIYEVRWNTAGTRVALSLNNNTVKILDPQLPK